MKVAAESTVEAAAGEEVLAVRRAFVSRVSRWSRDSPPASGPGSGLRARRLDPRSLEVCDIDGNGPKLANVTDAVPLFPQPTIEGTT